LLTSRSACSRFSDGSRGRHPTAVPLSTPALLQQSPLIGNITGKVDDNNDYLFWRFKQSRLYFHPDVEIVILVILN
jgi:hypothetical protein